MKDITCFSANTLAQFDNKYENIVTFNSLMMDAGNNVYDKYSKEDTQTIIRNQFDKILGLNFREANSMKRRQAWREHNKEIATLRLEHSQCSFHGVYSGCKYCRG